MFQPFHPGGVEILLLAESCYRNLWISSDSYDLVDSNASPFFQSLPQLLEPISNFFFSVFKLHIQITKQQIALKRCRMDLNAHNKKLWRQEVDIMKRLDHPNLVSAKDVPVPLDVKDDELPLLAMEFCSGGDLRKVSYSMTF